jgi:hypothetical protein
MKTSYLLIAGAFALSACVGSGPRQPVTEVTFSSQSPHALLGYDETLVQVVAPKDMSRVFSVINPRDGVPCQLKSPYYSANFVTPGKVLLPDYGSKSPKVSVTCTYQGVTRTVSADPFDATAAAARANVAGDETEIGAVLVGALVESVVSIDRQGKNDWAYPTISVHYQSMETR